MNSPLKKILYTINNGSLASCVSMYFGTGWSLVLFSFPVVNQLTTSNYYLQFVPQVTTATVFFTWVTALIMVNAIILLIEERKTPLKWFGAGVLLTVIVATALTEIYLLPYNKQMASGITSETELKYILEKWMKLNKIRVGIWSIQWLLVMIYFFIKMNKKPVTHES